MADAQSKRLNVKLHVGTMGWSYSFWKGGFYPKDLPAKDFLSYYSNKFNSVEVNSTFYRIPTEKALTEWSHQTPEGFKFSLKFPAQITHIKMLRGSQDETRIFIERASVLKEKLGILLLQLPPTFGQERFSNLSDFLTSLPKKYRYAVECRNNSLLNDKVYDLLRENKVALTWVEAAKMPLIMEVTSDFIYLRWEGDRKTVKGTEGKTEKDRTDSIKEWAEKIRMLDSANAEVFGYFSKFYSGLPPLDATELMKAIQ